jgi:hypothetical protein
MHWYLIFIHLIHHCHHAGLPFGCNPKLLAVCVKVN